MTSPAPILGARWSTSIEEQALDSLYCSKPWLDLITAVYGYTFIPLTTTDTAGRITGFLPVSLFRSPLRGRRLVALPFSDQCPLLATDAAAADDLTDQAIRLAQAQQARYLELRTGVNDVLAARADLAPSNLYVDYQVTLTEDPAAAWKRLKASACRYRVKRARRLGVQVRMASSREDMLDYYRLHLRTRSKKHGMPAQPRSFFLGLWDTFAATRAIHVFLAEFRGVAIAAGIVLTAGATAKWAYSASDERYLELAPNHLLMWSAIEWGCLHGYHTLDLGRTARDNAGLMEFKRHFGGVAKPLTYYYYPHPAGLAATSESSWKYRTLTSCWRRLPLSVAAPLGGRLYKHLG